MSDEEIQELISDQDKALRQWYQGFMAPANDGYTLTGGPLPSLRDIGAIFDKWFERRREELRILLCEKLQYMKIRPGGREALEITVVGTVASIIASSHLAHQVEPVATAALLLSRRSLDGLCNKAPAGKDQATDARE